METASSTINGCNGCSTTTCQTLDDVFISWVNGAMAAMGEIRKEANTPTKTLAGPKTKVKVAKGCWNVRTMFSVGKTAQITTEMDCYGIGILGVSEYRWSGFGRLKTQIGEAIIYSVWDDSAHQGRVAKIMSKKVTPCLKSWRPINNRMITACFYSRCIETTIIQVYHPTNKAEEEERENLYEQLQKVVDAAPRQDMLLILSDWYAKVR